MKLYLISSIDVNRKKLLKKNYTTLNSIILRNIINYQVEE